MGPGDTIGFHAENLFEWSVDGRDQFMRVVPVVAT